MSICALCQNNEANKKNTHYLTDSIIRICLNINGTNDREKGFYFKIDAVSPFIEMNFQKLDECTLEELIGRKPTDEEIEKAKNIPFSVDYIFCAKCEDRFTKIETPFIQNILPQFRKKNLSDMEYLNIEDYKLCRLFFYIQIFRSAIVENIIKLNPATLEKLRQSIMLENDNKDFPLKVCYLETLGDEKAYTENHVGYTSDKNPFIILMNDFIIQFYETKESLRYLDFHGLNSDDKDLNYINYDEDIFRIKIVDNKKRKEFLYNLVLNEKVKPLIEWYKNAFNSIWIKLFNVSAPKNVQMDYLKELIDNNPENILKFTKEDVFAFTSKYLRRILKKYIAE